MGGFAFVIGKCVLVPPSPKAALAILSLFYGIGVTSEVDVVDYKSVIAEQYVAAGQSSAQAANAMAHLDACIATYQPTPMRPAMHSNP